MWKMSLKPRSADRDNQSRVKALVFEALGRNPDGDMPGASFEFPEGGRGPVFWAAAPIRWKGDPVVNGFDFAWWLPPGG